MFRPPNLVSFLLGLLICSCLLRDLRCSRILAALHVYICFCVDCFFSSLCSLIQSLLLDLPSSSRSLVKWKLGQNIAGRLNELGARINISWRLTKLILMEKQRKNYCDQSIDNGGSSEPERSGV